MPIQIYIENFSSKKNLKNFRQKTLIFFKYLLKTGGSNEYPQSMLLSKNTKIMYTLYTPVLQYKSGVKGGQNYISRFSWWLYSSAPIDSVREQERPWSDWAVAQTWLGLRSTQILRKEIFACRGSCSSLFCIVTVWWNQGGSRMMIRSNYRIYNVFEHFFKPYLFRKIREKKQKKKL